MPIKLDWGGVKPGLQFLGMFILAYLITKPVMKYFAIKVPIPGLSDLILS
jgi:hypothetical protein